MTRFFIVVCLSALASSVMAQASLEPSLFSPHVILKLAPLSRLDPDATYQGAIECSTGPKTSVQLELGYGGPELQVGGSGPSPFSSNHYVEGKEVWRVRAERRFYRQRVGQISVHTRNGRAPVVCLSGTYFAFEGLYKQINVARLDTILSRGAIRSFVEAPVVRSAYAVHGKLGIQEPLSGKATSFFSRIVLDVYGGIGIRYERVDPLNDTTRQLFSSQRINDRFTSYTYKIGETSWGPSLSIGFKIGVSL